MRTLLRRSSAVLAASALAALAGAWPASPAASSAPAAPPTLTSKADALRSFTAKRAGGRSVTLRWRTTTEANMLGFNVYRRQNGETRRRLIERLIPAQNAAEGASYAYGDHLTKAGPARYWLQGEQADGARRWLGSTVLR